jgi:hypothetical protein
MRPAFLEHATFSRHARNKKDLHRGDFYDLLREAKATPLSELER